MSLETIVVIEGEGPADIPLGLRAEDTVYGRGLAYSGDYLDELSHRLGLGPWWAFHADLGRIRSEVAAEMGDSETVEDEDRQWEETMRRAPYFSSDEGLAYFKSILGHLEANEESSRADLYRAGGSFAEVVGDLRTVIGILEILARESKRFHLSVS